MKAPTSINATPDDFDYFWGKEFASFICFGNSATPPEYKGGFGRITQHRAKSEDSAERVWIHSEITGFLFSGFLFSSQTSAQKQKRRKSPYSVFSGIRQGRSTGNTNFLHYSQSAGIFLAFLGALKSIVLSFWREEWRRLG